jgi:hypothetical protein
MPAGNTSGGEPARLPISVRQDKSNTVLMIQWAIWKHLGPTLEMLKVDGERIQRIAETLSDKFYDEGMRMPLDDDSEETPITLMAELMNVTNEIGPLPMPMKMVRERAKIAGKKLYDRGWRKYAIVAVVLVSHTVFFT